MSYLMDIIKGIFIGIANIIPGVSGGTMAVSLGIYDKLISSISNLFKSFKKSILTLLPILLGCVIGIIGFTYLIEYLLSKHTFVTCMTFIGLIAGGVPILISSLTSKIRQTHSKIGVPQIAAFLLLFAFSIVLPMLQSKDEVLLALNPTPFTMALLLIIGIIASATMVIPGVSGSLVLMILGYYYGIIDSLKSFVEALKVWDMDGLVHGIMILLPFGIGVLIGIFLIAKLIEYLFRKHATTTYCAILGLIASSPIAIFYNTGLFSKLTDLNLWIIILGILLCIIGAVITYVMGERE